MRFFKKFGRYNVVELAEQLDANPHLWNEHNQRTVNDTFRGTDDIWLRWRAREELKEPKHYAEPHFAVFYPAWYALPAVRPIVVDILHRVSAVHLGGILITRIPPGGRIKPHHDRGTWHPEFYKTKLYVPIITNDRCLNRCEDETVVMRQGDLWFFDNLVTHEVVNDGDCERITLIVCTRTIDDETRPPKHI